MESLLHSGGRFLSKGLSPLFSFLPRGDKNYLSLDIGSSSIKMLEVRGSGSAMRILNAGIAPLPPNAVQGNVVQDSGSVSQAIRALLERQGVKTTEVVAAVPGPAVIIKRATFPVQDPKDLEETILFEAGNFIPESLDNVNLDYQVLDPDPAATDDVLLVAVRKDVLNGYVTAISEGGLIPVVVDVDYFALENMFEANYTPGPEEVVALINIGARYSSINIMKGKRSMFTGDVPVGGRQCTDLLARELGLDYDKAEEGGSEGAAFEKIITAASEQLLDEVQRALSFFWVGSAEEQVSTVYLSGGSAQLPGLAQAMSKRLQIPVEVSNPFRQLTISRHADEQFIQQHASALAVSVGLATRRPGDK
ncbi:MAG: type IV pilus assembly protein PilM [Deltaproteobacteria bacterium]|nr:MAG: type IV pilus assembly protein PilM [Deltaproteobacteria bacterium]